MFFILCFPPRGILPTRNVRGRKRMEPARGAGWAVNAAESPSALRAAQTASCHTSPGKNTRLQLLTASPFPLCDPPCFSSSLTLHCAGVVQVSTPPLAPAAASCAMSPFKSPVNLFLQRRLLLEIAGFQIKYARKVGSSAWGERKKSKPSRHPNF